jgi:hypothetical protein
MSNIESLIDALVEADRIVIAGLTAFDEVMGRMTAAELEKARARMTATGHDEAAIAAFAEERHESVAQARRRAHREIWLRALGKIKIPVEVLVSMKGEA